MASWISSSRKNLVYQTASLAQEVRTFERDFRELYDCEVTRILDSVQQLEGLQRTDFERIRLSLYDAARANVAVGWWSIFWGTCKSRKRVLALIALAFILTVSLVIGILPKPSSVPSQDVLAGLLLAGLIMAIRNIIHRRIDYRFSSVIILAETALAIASLATFGKWNGYVSNRWREMVNSLVPVKAEPKLHLMTAPAAEVLQLAIWIIVVFGIFGLMAKYAGFEGRLFASKRDLGYSRAEIVNAQLVISLFDISYAADTLCWSLPKGPGITARSLQLPSDGDRRKIDYRLKVAAQHVRKPWAAAMARNNGAAGRWIAAQAPRIEFYLQYQRARNVLCGSNLEDLRYSMMTAAMQAIEGRWHLIGAGDSEFVATVRAYHWKSVMRRVLAIILPCVAAFIVANYMSHLSSQYRNLIVLTCIGYAGIQVLSLIDPEFSGRIDVAGKLVASVIRRG